MSSFTAIAAMSENRVIGNGNEIPWHLPDDFKFFKATTMGHILLMGRKTFESIGRPLPGRETIVLSRSGFSHDGVQTISSIDDLKSPPDRTVFVCGGAEIYKLLLSRCDDLFLTHVKGTVDGDAFFPPFEREFSANKTIQENDKFTIIHYQRRLP